MGIVIRLGIIGGIILGTLFTIAAIFLNYWPEASLFKAFAHQHEEFLPPLPKHIPLSGYFKWLLFHCGIGFFIGATLGLLYRYIIQFAQGK